jgi:hypothetical protein
MFLQSKYGAGITAHPFEHTIAVEQSMVIDTDLRVRFVVELARDIDLK